MKGGTKIMRITRRDFMKYCAVAAGALGLTASNLGKLQQALATPTSLGGTNVVWLNGAACTGCTMTLTNSFYYGSIQDLLVPWSVAATLPGLSDLDDNKADGLLNMKYIETLSSPIDGRAVAEATSVLTTGENFVLVLEGAIPTAGGGQYLTIWTENGEDKTFADTVIRFATASNCVAVITAGTCSSYGGIPGAKGSVTDARGLISPGAITGGYTHTTSLGLWDQLKKAPITGVNGGLKISNATYTSVMRKTICVPGCPPHPDWIVGTIVYYLTFGEVPLMDKYHRPLDYYGEYQCTNCLWKTNIPAESPSDIANATKASKSGCATGNSPLLFKNKYDGRDEGCLGVVGCKGRKTKADCSFRRWNTDNANGAGVSWCVQTRGGCHGCTEPRFPDGWGKFFSYV